MLDKLGQESRVHKAATEVVKEAVDAENLAVTHKILDRELRVSKNPEAAQPLRIEMAAKRKAELLAWLR